MKGTLKNLTNVFKRYRNPYLSLDKRFIAPDRRSDKITDLISESLQDDSFSSFLKYIRATKFTKLDNISNLLIYILDIFSDQTISDEDLESFIDLSIAENPKLLAVDLIGRDQISFKLQNKEFDAQTLSSIYPSLQELFPDILTHKTRHGRCHEMSIGLALNLSDDAIVATGSIYTISPRAKYLHSWVEEDVDGETYCRDFTYNISLKQDDYYSLFHIKPYDKISAKQIKADYHDIIKLLDTDERYSKLYLSSREEALRIAKTLPDCTDSLNPSINN